MADELSCPDVALEQNRVTAQWSCILEALPFGIVKVDVATADGPLHQSPTKPTS